MPFRDRDWEDFQRDCDFFPAYTDYIFGMDTRPEVDDEPGLHPQIFDSPQVPQPPPQRLYGLPQPVQYPVAYDPVRAANQARHYNIPVLQRTLMVRQESSMDSMQPTPCPAPRVLPAAGPQDKLLLPNELATDPAYFFIPQHERMIVNKNIIQAWSILHSDVIPVQKAKAMGFLRSTSRTAAAQRQEYEALLAEMKAEEEWQLHAESSQAEAEAGREAEQGQIRHSYHGSVLDHANHHAEAEADRAASIRVDHEYAIRDLSYLPAYVQSHLAQLWACLEIIALQAPPSDLGQLNVHRRAQQYFMAFQQSVPPEGRRWVSLVTDGMLKLRKQGDDPMAVLQTMPSVKSTW